MQHQGRSVQTESCRSEGLSDEKPREAKGYFCKNNELERPKNEGFPGEKEKR